LQMLLINYTIVCALIFWFGYNFVIFWIELGTILAPWLLEKGECT
jgi:hypothetical protein